MARIDERFKTPLARAKARAKRNGRHIKTPDREYKRYFKFQAASGAFPGSKGDEVYGKPLDSHKSFGIFTPSNSSPGYSVLSVHIFWSKQHKRKEWRDRCKQDAIAIILKKIEERKTYINPKLENI